MELYNVSCRFTNVGLFVIEFDCNFEKSLPKLFSGAFKKFM